MYGVMDEVFKFVETFKEFPPRSFPPSFNPANIMESTIDGVKQRRELRESIDLERIRGGLNKMIDEALQHRGAQ
jgi:arylsulfatase